MHNISESIFWNETVKDYHAYQEKQELENSLPFWHIPSLSRRTQEMNCYATTLPLLLKQIYSTVNKTNNTIKLGGWRFHTNPINNFNQIFQSFRDDILSQETDKEELNRKRCLLEDVQKNELEWLKNMGAMGMNSLSKEKTNEFVFTSGMSSQEIEKWFQSIQLKSLHYFSETLVCSVKPCVYHPEDLKFLNVKMQPLVDSKTLTGFNYSLLKKREERAKEDIINNKINSQLIEDLKQWNYQFIANPVEGDLVLYFDQAKLEHMGIYMQEGLVESKWGVGNPSIYTHKVFDVMPNYGGTKVMFMRKYIVS